MEWWIILVGMPYPIWREQASFDRISSWTPLKPQHSNPNPNPNPISYVLTSFLISYLSSSLTDSLPSLNFLCHPKTNAIFMKDTPKAVWSIPYFSVAFSPSLKQNIIAYRSSKVFSCPDCTFEIHQLRQSDFSRVYSNCCCCCSVESEITKFGQSSHTMYRYNIVNFQVSTPILNASTKKSLNLLYAPRILGTIQFPINFIPLYWTVSFYVFLQYQTPNWTIFVLWRESFCFFEAFWRILSY